jgi:protein pelota
MKVLSIDKLKRRIKLIPETSIDLLNIYRLIEPGDTVYSETTREVKKERAYGEVDSERVKIKIGIEVSKKTADPLMRRISLLGIVKYVDRELDIIKKHHTIHLEPEKPVEIESRDRFPFLLSLAKTAATKITHEILCISIDDEKFAVIHISNAGVKILRTRDLTPPVKTLMQHQEDDSFRRNVEEVIKIVEEELEPRRKIEVVLLGPSVMIERFSKEIKARKPELGRLIKRHISASSGGIEGFLEAMRTGAIGRNLKPLEDAFIVEDAIRHASKNPELAKMGVEEVYRAISSGKRGIVLVTENYLWSSLEDSRIQLILSEAEKGRIELRTILSGTEAAEKVDSLGGIVMINK